MNQIITDVVKALNKVEHKYYSLPTAVFNDNYNSLETAEKCKPYERRFMMEFAAQYRVIINNKPNFYVSTDQDFEIPKQFMFSDHSDDLIRETWQELNKKSNGKVDMIKYFTTYPDFLIHKSQDDRTPNNQKLILEAKVNPSPDKYEIFKDIFHINIYSEKYLFQNNVILLVNLTKDKWISFYNEYKSNKYFSASSERLNYIYAIFKKSFDSSPSILPLSSLR